MFKSPQTGSIYEVVGKVCRDPQNREDNVRICYRSLGYDYRVRIQGETSVLEGIQKQLSPELDWSHIKDGDHISTVVGPQKLGAAIADAMNATVRSYLLGLEPEVVEEEEELEDEENLEDEDGF